MVSRLPDHARSIFGRHAGAVDHFGAGAARARQRIDSRSPRVGQLFHLEFELSRAHRVEVVVESAAGCVAPRGNKLPIGQTLTTPAVRGAGR